MFRPLFISGDMAERLKAATLKIAVGARTTNRGFESLCLRLCNKYSKVRRQFVKIVNFIQVYRHLRKEVRYGYE